MSDGAITSPSIERAEHLDENIPAKRVANYIAPDGVTWERYTGTDPSYALQIDDVSATLSYIGKAAPGSATSAAVWQIKKVDTTSGTIITWASGSSNFNQIWDNRASLSYS